MRILVAPNAFKGSMNSLAAAEAIKAGILAACPDCEVLCTPVADGGDGLLEVLTEVLSGEIVQSEVHGPRMERLISSFGYIESLHLGIVEMALASGLALLPENLQNPYETTTYGTGELIMAALDRGAARIVVGLGGSATCDGGIGMAAALGYRFYDTKGKELMPVGASLLQIHSIDIEGVDPRIAATRIEAVCDVTNPLTGPEGASFVYSPQKGANREQVRELDAGLKNLVSVVKEDLKIDIDHPGAGAAGGLGGGMLAFCKAELHRGIELVIDIVGLKKKLAGAALVITGEGQIDFQTRFDKAPAGVARAAAEVGIPCIAICGSVGERIEELHELGIAAVFSICRGPLSLQTAMAKGPELLALTTEHVVRAFLAGKS